MDFFGRLYLGPYMVLRPEIFTYDWDWQRLTNTHPKGDGGPPKKSWKLKICLKIQRARVNNLRNSGSIFIKLFHATCHYCERNLVFMKLILHSNLRRRAASRLALPCPSSLFQFYPLDAMHSAVFARATCPSVCPSICPPHSGIVSQESCAIAKMTAQCAIYMGALKIFGTPWLRPCLLFQTVFTGFCSDRPSECC